MNFPFEIRSANDFDAVGFGTNAVDYLIRVPQYPAFNTKLELRNYSVAAGGEVASSMVGLSRLGLATSYVGRFGDDHAGSIGRSSLSVESVDMTYAETIADTATQVAFIIVDEQTGERTVLWQRDQNLSYSAAEAPLEAAKRGRVLHLTPHDVEACIAMARSAKDAGVIVSADVDNVFDGIEELLSLVDVCIVSADLPSRLVGISEHDRALKELSLRFGCGVTGLTLGDKGSLIFCQGEMIKTPAFDVPGGCVDTTGAGDSFRCGFIFGMITGKTVEESARTANAVAALKCRGQGARSALPTLAELNALL